PRFTCAKRRHPTTNSENCLRGTLSRRQVQQLVRHRPSANDCYVTDLAAEYKTTITIQPTIHIKNNTRYQTTILNALGSLFIQPGVAKIHDVETANRAI